MSRQLHANDENIHDMVKKYIEGDPVIRSYGPIGSWDVSNVTQMYTLFKDTLFNEDISEWDVSNVVNMSLMFFNAHNFNKPLNKWKEKVRKVKQMVSMFEYAIHFNQPLDEWNMSNVVETTGMFKGAINFNQPLNNWKFNNLTYMVSMFRDARSFNQPLNDWKVDNVITMAGLFKGATQFNQPLDKWDVRKVTSMTEMFKNATHFNQSLNNWVISSRTIVRDMFEGATSMQEENKPRQLRGQQRRIPQQLQSPQVYRRLRVSDENIREAINEYMKGNVNVTKYGRIGDWDVNNVTNMDYLFKNNERFNEDISNWDVSNVESMREMFANAIQFNQPLNTWIVNNVVDMTSMFANAMQFNQPLDKWNVSNVENMREMFEKAIHFNQPLNKWNVGDVRSMREMFENAKMFNQPLNDWEIGDKTEINDMFVGAISMEEINKPSGGTIVTESIEDKVIRERTIIQRAMEKIPEATERVQFSVENDCLDIINGDTPTIKQALENENVVFVFYTDDIKKSQRVAISREVLSDALKTRNIYSYIVYQCVVANTMRRENINKSKPYLDIKKLTGFGDLIELQKFDITNQQVFLFKQSGEKLESTISYDVLFMGGSYISARHCQEGQGGIIYTPVSCILTAEPVSGGKRKSQKSQRKLKRTSKKGTMKKLRKGRYRNRYRHR